MKNIELIIPKLNEYYYEQRLENDLDTMSYNAGYDVYYDYISMSKEFLRNTNNLFQINYKMYYEIVVHIITKIYLNFNNEFIESSIIK